MTMSDETFTTKPDEGAGGDGGEPAPKKTGVLRGMAEGLVSIVGKVRSAVSRGKKSKAKPKRAAKPRAKPAARGAKQAAAKPKRAAKPAAKRGGKTATKSAARAKPKARAGGAKRRRAAK